MFLCYQNHLKQKIKWNKSVLHLPNAVESKTKNKSMFFCVWFTVYKNTTATIVSTRIRTKHKLTNFWTSTRGSVNWSLITTWTLFVELSTFRLRKFHGQNSSLKRVSAQKYYFVLQKGITKQGRFLVCSSYCSFHRSPR